MSRVSTRRKRKKSEIELKEDQKPRKGELLQKSKNATIHVDEEDDFYITPSPPSAPKTSSTLNPVIANNSLQVVPVNGNNNSIQAGVNPAEPKVLTRFFLF